eukprot:gene5980-7337_t
MMNKINFLGLQTVEALLEKGLNINAVGLDGLVPLCVAAFWGHASLVEFLLQKGANVNAQNQNNKWTALHAAAIQGHGKVVFSLFEYKPDTSILDARGCTAGDYASALDSVWPHFAAVGVKRTSKADLISKGIIFKIEKTLSEHPPAASHLNRPGSSYAFRQQNLLSGRPAVFGDILAEDDEPDGGTSRRSNNKQISSIPSLFHG